MVSLAIPFLLLLSGLPLRKIKGGQELIRDLLFSREEKIPEFEGLRGKKEFLEKAANKNGN